MPGGARLAMLAPPRARNRAFTQTFSASGGLLGFNFGVRSAVAAALIRLATRLGGGTTVVQLHQTQIFNHGTYVQVTFNQVATPAQILGGSAVFETSSHDAVDTIEPLPTGGYVYVRYQDVSKNPSPNVDLDTTCQGAVMQGNGQRSVAFVVTPPRNRLPTAIVGKNNQLTVYLPNWPDTKRYIGVRLDVVPG